MLLNLELDRVARIVHRVVDVLRQGLTFKCNTRLDHCQALQDLLMQGAGGADKSIGGCLGNLGELELLLIAVDLPGDRLTRFEHPQAHGLHGHLAILEGSELVDHLHLAGESEAFVSELHHIAAFDESHRTARHRVPEAVFAVGGECGQFVGRERA